VYLRAYKSLAPPHELMAEESTRTAREVKGILLIRRWKPVPHSRVLRPDVGDAVTD
jgi:hypothetical protein